MSPERSFITPRVHRGETPLQPPAMFPVLTVKFREILDAAEAFARDSNHEYVASEHLFIAAVEMKDGQIAQAIKSCNVNTSEIARVLRESFPPASENPNIEGQLPLSPAAQQIFAHAVRSAKMLHLQKAPSRMLMLALLDEATPTIKQALSAADISVECLKDSLAADFDTTEQ